MAKQNGTKLRNLIYITIGIVTLASMFAGAVLAWGDHSNKIEVQEEKMLEIIADADNLEVEGCKPAQKASVDIQLMQQNVGYIQEDIEDIVIEQIEQRAESKEQFEKIHEKMDESFDKILKKMDEK